MPLGRQGGHLRRQLLAHRVGGNEGGTGLLDRQGAGARRGCPNGSRPAGGRLPGLLGLGGVVGDQFGRKQPANPVRGPDGEVCGVRPARHDGGLQQRDLGDLRVRQTGTECPRRPRHVDGRRRGLDDAASLRDRGDPPASRARELDVAAGAADAHHRDLRIGQRPSAGVDDGDMHRLARRRVGRIYDHLPDEGARGSGLVGHRFPFRRRILSAGSLRQWRAANGATPSLGGVVLCDHSGLEANQSSRHAP